MAKPDVEQQKTPKAGKDKPEIDRSHEQGPGGKPEVQHRGELNPGSAGTPGGKGKHDAPQNQKR